tara:strand:- start:248 stop:874 length:627 start_codon:yes stop_codon:yes gene_type:complete
MSIRKTSLGQSKKGFSYYPAEFLNKLKFNKLLSKSFLPNTVLDLGCGYNFLLLKKHIDKFEKVYLADVSINKEEAKKNNNIVLLIGDIHETINSLADSSIGLVYANNIIEHLSEPQIVLESLKRITTENSVIYVSVPSWLGKSVLEFFAFVLKIAPIEEMQDHKFYFNKKQLWQLLVDSGFKPASIKIKYNKFGMTTGATIKKNQRIT